MRIPSSQQLPIYHGYWNRNRFIIKCGDDKNTQINCYTRNEMFLTFVFLYFDICVFTLSLLFVSVPCVWFVIAIYNRTDRQRYHHHHHHRGHQENNILVTTPVHGSSKRECGLLPRHHDNRMFHPLTLHWFSTVFTPIGGTAAAAATTTTTTTTTTTVYYYYVLSF